MFLQNPHSPRAPLPRAGLLLPGTTMKSDAAGVAAPMTQGALALQQRGQPRLTTPTSTLQLSSSKNLPLGESLLSEHTPSPFAESLLSECPNGETTEFDADAPSGPMMAGRASAAASQHIGFAESQSFSPPGFATQFPLTPVAAAAGTRERLGSFTLRSESSDSARLGETLEHCADVLRDIHLTRRDCSCSSHHDRHHRCRSAPHALSALHTTDSPLGESLLSEHTLSPFAESLLSECPNGESLVDGADGARGVCPPPPPPAALESERGVAGRGVRQGDWHTRTVLITFCDDTVVRHPSRSPSYYRPIALSAASLRLVMDCVYRDACGMPPPPPASCTSTAPPGSVAVAEQDWMSC